MSKSVKYIILLIFFSMVSLFGQISPGDLSEAHSDLEGLFKCTQCHVLGEKVSDQKCLTCHTEIQDLVNADRGFHVSDEVKKQDCASCHSDHHGRKFDMIRFDEENFDHLLAGYELEGAHKRIDCRECHKSDFIDDPELRKKENTFLGLETECVSCHTDYHQSTLSVNCNECHDTEAFRPAPFFDHNDTEFALLGKHLDVDCLECHSIETRQGEEFQNFTDLEFGNCNSCHNDPHQNAFGQNCKECHTEESFQSFRGQDNFNHSKTGFVLRGEHARLDCRKCHDMTVGSTNLFKDLANIQNQDCASCHDDIHEGKFSSSCSECHSEKSFAILNNSNTFNHNETNFELLGKHQTVDCKECHLEKMTDPLAHNLCSECHVDYHEGQFIKQDHTPDCKECHSESGFSTTLFTLDDHNETQFPLTGGHLATPCSSCHKEGENWNFSIPGNYCTNCHTDVHEGYLSTIYYPEESCENCHTTSAWEDVSFDHNETGYILSGVHSTIDCASCHLIDEPDTNSKKHLDFINTEKDCIACHENIHGQQFEIDGITECSSCHGFDDWWPINFNHDNTAFILDGQHAEIDCNECHIETIVNNETIVQYKFESFECIDCHQ
jgi:hypothetical protein